MFRQVKQNRCFCVSKANMSPLTAVLKCPNDKEVYLHDYGNVREAKGQTEPFKVF